MIADETDHTLDDGIFLERIRAAAIGAGGLGELIFQGVASVDNGLVLAGAVPAALLALCADGLLGLFEKRLTVRR